ncbi:MAG: hypothetical protein QQN63_10015 [Nitrosopumilus sp.]
MVKLNLTKTLEKEVLKLTELEGYNAIEDYITEKLVLLVVNEITYTDVENTQKKIKTLQDDLNKKRQEILTELREKGGND